MTSNQPATVRRRVDLWLTIGASLIWVLITNASAQVPTHRAIALSRSDAKALAAQKNAIKSRSRFLGWKFAATSGQDTSGWIRPHGSSPDASALAAANLIGPRFQGMLASGAGGAANVGFGLRPGLPAGFIPTAVTYGDFNEDGNMDFAVSNGGDNTIYVFLGNGDDTFQVPEVLYTNGQSPNWITAVRLRPTGHLDLAVTDGDSSTVEIFPGNGDGTFNSSTQIPLPQIPSFILAADVNNDGNPDLVIGLVIDVGATEPQLAVLFGNGSGGFSGTVFSPPIQGSLNVSLPTGWIAAGDTNKDGYVDFVTTVTGGFFVQYLNQFGKNFLIGPGNGYNDYPMVVGLGDMDEDGCLDIVQFGTMGLVTIAKGTCDGNFDPNPNVIAMVGDLDPAIAIADVDGDGHLDLVGSAADYLVGSGGLGAEGGYLVSVLKGDGKGDLSQAQVYRGGTNAYSLLLADFKSNNRPDILTPDSLEDQLTLFSNDGTGHFGSPQGETIGYPNTFSTPNVPDVLSPTKTADLNGDGKPDLLMVEYPPVYGAPPQLTAILNDGTGNFLPPVRSPITGEIGTPMPIFVAGTFRSAAPLDVIYANTYSAAGSPFSVLYFAGNGDGTFGAPKILATLYSPQQMVAGDFNNDGNLDFLTLGTNSTGQNWQIDVFLGHGDGTFTHLAPQLFPLPLSYQNANFSISPQQLFAIDLNQDGKLDLLVGLNGNNGWLPSGDDLVEVTGNGDGTFQAPAILFPHFGAVAVADINHDGFLDLIQSRDPNTNIAQSLFSPPGVTVYLGSSSGAFQQQPSYDLPGVTLSSSSPPLVGDFNGDGTPDIAVRYWPAVPSGPLVEAQLRILQGVGDGTFIVTGHQYQLQGGSYPFVGGDFDGDGTTDLVELTGLTSSFHTIPGASGPGLDIVLSSKLLLGTYGTATVTLDVPATGTQTVALSASDPAITLPASIVFAAGQQSQTFSFSLGPGLDAQHLVAMYAKLGAQSAVAYGTKPNPNLVTGVGVNIATPPGPHGGIVSVEPGESFQVGYSLTSQGGYSGRFSSLQCTGLPAGTSCSFAGSTITVVPGGSSGVNLAVSTSSLTPFGMSTVTISSTDGILTPVGSFQLGIGDFSVNANPNPIVVGPSGNAVATVTATATNGLSEQLTFSCTGLPSGTQCGPNSFLYTDGGTVGFGIGHSQLAPNDYPFQITATANITSHTINEVLRVGDFSASLDKTAATLANGQSATFNLTLTSVNHYNSTITVFCQSPSTNVTCTLSGTSAALADGGTATVQLVVKDISGASRGRAAVLHSLGERYLISLVFPACLLLVRRRRAGLLICLVVVLGAAGLNSCGAGGIGVSAGNGGGGGGSGAGGGGVISQTVSLSVVAQAATRATDTFNQKTLPPIVITLN